MSTSNGRGLPQELATRIARLSGLLDGLPATLPIEPRDSEGAYRFGLDAEDEKEEGVLYAFNRSLEITFRTHQNPDLVINQRGPCFKDLIKIFKNVAKQITPSERDNQDGHFRRWLERLIEAAEKAGAKVVKKK